MTTPLALTSFSRTKRTTPEAGLDCEKRSDKRTRLQVISENTLAGHQVAESSSSSLQKLSSSRAIVPILTASEIVRKYAPLFLQPSTVGAIYAGHVNMSTKIEPELPHTYFEVAIFSKLWIFANMILKADLSLPVSIQGVTVPQTELCVLSWAATNDQWDFVHLLLSRNTFLIQVDLRELPTTLGKVKKIRSFYFEQSSLIKEGDYDHDLKNLFARTLFKAIKMQYWDIVELLVEKNPHIPASCYSESILLLVFAKQWNLLKKILVIHPSLAKRTRSPSSRATSPYQNCSILWFLAYYNKTGIIRSIINKIDLNLFFETPIESGIYSQTSAFAILSLGNQRDLVEYLLDFVKDNRSYDSMRLSQKTYTLSILDHAVGAKKWYLLLFLFKYYLEHRPHLPELKNNKILSSIDQIIRVNCKHEPVRIELINSFSQILQHYHPTRLVQPTLDITKADPEDPEAWENVLNMMVGVSSRAEPLLNHPSEPVKDDLLTEPPEQLFSFYL